MKPPDALPGKPPAATSAQLQNTVVRAENQVLRKRMKALKLALRETRARLRDVSRRLNPHLLKTNRRRKVRQTN